MSRRLDVAGLLALDDGSRLSLTNYYGAPAGSGNLTKLDAAGTVLWTAELLQDINPHYVAAELIDGRIFANSFNCFRVELDRSNGKILSSTFTK